MNTLILSDQDGTLLGPGAALSTSTRDGVNDLVANGLLAGAVGSALLALLLWRRR